MFDWQVKKLYVDVFLCVTPCFKEKQAGSPGSRVERRCETTIRLHPLKMKLNFTAVCFTP